jgi:hypothetical protein
MIAAFMALSACEERVADDQKQISTEIEKDFPNDFLGIYKGDLSIVTSNGTNAVPMEFHLLETADSMKYAYKIYYGKERSERAYNLIQTDNPHIFEVDENNGIVIPTAYSNNTLYSTYEVNGSLLNCTEVFHDDRMEFMITMSSQMDTITAGEAEGFRVKAYPVSVMQKAVLFKIPDTTLVD